MLPTWQDIHVWESLAAALSPLEDLTDFLSGDTHVTVSSVIPVLYNLANKILKEKQNDSTLTKNIKLRIIDYMEEKYTNFKTKEILNIATFLDPRFKTDFVEGVDLETVHDNIIDQGMEILSNPNLSDAAVRSQASIQEGQEPPTKKRKLLMFLQKETGSASGTAVIVHLFNSYKLKLKLTKHHLNLRLIAMKHP